MPFDIACTNCQSRLRVTDDSAGKRVKCTNCGDILYVPVDLAGQSPRVSTAAVPDEPPDRWEMKTPDGTVYGPVTKDELDGWVQDGRVDGNCRLRRPGESWKPATSVYSFLPTPARPVRASGTGNLPVASASLAGVADPQPTRYLSDKSRSTAGVLGLFLGVLGVHRFYLGYVGYGLLLLFTVGGCGVWWIIDATMILCGAVPDSQGRPLRD